MSKENNIRKGLLSEKMRNFHAEPPADAWDNIASQLPTGGGSRKVFLIVLTAAAGLALAITVGVKLIDRVPELPVAENQAQEQIPDEVPAIEERVEDEGRLEARVQIALEEVIEEINNEAVPVVAKEEVILADNLEKTQDLISNDLEPEMADQQDNDTLEDQEENDALEDQEENDAVEEQQENGISEDVQENAVTNEQQVIDVADSQRYLDSISAAHIPGDELIPDNEIEQKKWQLGASLSPLFSYRDASSPDQTQNLAANNSEAGMLAYSGGVQVRYAQSKRLTFESGLYYNKMGLAIGNFETYRSNMDYMVENVTYTDNSIVSMSNSIGRISNTSSADVVVNSWAGSAPEIDASLDSKEMRLEDEVVNSFVQSLEYLEIPFNIKYKVLDKELKVLLIGGISTNLLIGNQVLANTDNGKMDYGSIQDIRTVNYSGNAGLGFVYEFPGNFSLSLEPRFRYYLNSINSDNLPVTRPYALGVYTGVNYTF